MGSMASSLLWVVQELYHQPHEMNFKRRDGASQIHDSRPQPELGEDPAASETMSSEASSCNEIHIHKYAYK